MAMDRDKKKVTPTNDAQGRGIDAPIGSNNPYADAMRMDNKKERVAPTNDAQGRGIDASIGSNNPYADAMRMPQQAGLLRLRVDESTAGPSTSVEDNPRASELTHTKPRDEQGTLDATRQESSDSSKKGKIRWDPRKIFNRNKPRDTAESEQKAEFEKKKEIILAEVDRRLDQKVREIIEKNSEMPEVQVRTEAKRCKGYLERELQHPKGLQKFQEKPEAMSNEIALKIKESLQYAIMDPNIKNRRIEITDQMFKAIGEKASPAVHGEGLRPLLDETPPSSSRDSLSGEGPDL